MSSGFTSAVALLIITSQIKDILGIRGGGTTFPQMVEKLLSNITDTRLGDSALGVICIIVLLLMRVSMRLHSVIILVPYRLLLRNTRSYVHIEI